MENEIDEQNFLRRSSEELERAAKLKRDFDNRYQHQPPHRTADLSSPTEIPQMENEIDEQNFLRQSSEELERAAKLKRDFDNRYQHQPPHRTADLSSPTEIPQMAPQQPYKG